MVMINRCPQRTYICHGTIVFIAILIAASLIYFYKLQMLHKEQYSDEKQRLIEILLTIDTAFWRNDDKNISLNQEAIVLAERIGDSNALAKALYQKAVLVRNLETSDTFLVISNQALSVAERCKNDTMIAKTKNIIGNYYLKRDNYYMAMMFYTEAMKGAEKMNNERLIGGISNGLGLLHMALNDYDKAIEYLLRTDRIIKKRSSVWEIASVSVNIGMCYFEKNELDSAMRYNEEALVISKQLQNYEMISKIYSNLGLIQQQLDNDSTALWYFKQALLYVDLPSNPRIFGTALQNLGAYYSDNGQLDQAEDIFHESMDIFSEIGYRSAEMKANLALSRIKEKEGQWEKAYAFQSRFLELQDSILNSETKRKISDYQWEIEFQKRKYERDLLLKKLEIQRTRNLLLTIIFVSVSVIVVLLIRNMKRSINLQKMNNARLLEKMEMTDKINELSKARFQAEIESKNKELITTSIQAIKRNEILESIKLLLDKSNDNHQIDSETYNNLNYVLSENLDFAKDYEHFKKMFVEVHRDFFTKLKAIGPELSETELRILAYLKINLQNKEIAKILNVSPATIFTNRYHIRKKLNLNDSTILEDIIREL